MSTSLHHIGFLAFDVFGTVVDWRSGVARAAQPFLERYDIDIDPFDFADEWRSLYQPAMQAVRSGERPWVRLDLLQRENLETVLARHGANFGAIAGADLADLNRAWERLDPWPDAVEGLTRLKHRFPIGSLSNSHIAGMLHLSRFGGLPWDAILGAEIAKSYKLRPTTATCRPRAPAASGPCSSGVPTNMARSRPRIWRRNTTGISSLTVSLK
jgi:2-haloacid dehalogenase